MSGTQTTDPLPNSPLSQSTKALWQEAIDLGAPREAALRDRLGKLRVDRANAEAKYQEVTTEAVLAGTFDEAARRRERIASGLEEIEAQVEATERALTVLPELRRRAQERFRQAQQREHREALDRLAKELKALTRKELVPALRALKPHLAEVERVAFGARLWAQEAGGAASPYGGHAFPIAPLSLRGLIDFLLAYHTPEIESR